MPKLTARPKRTPNPPFSWLISKQQLYKRGIERVQLFCDHNKLPQPTIQSIEEVDWPFDACAYWRPPTDKEYKHLKTGINICLSACAKPGSPTQSRNWNWPGSVTDREPYGVLCHELGHAMDYYASSQQGSYGGNYSVIMRKLSKEPPITSYCPNDWEWFAEIVRLFITNHALLYHIRPKTWRLLMDRWEPVSATDWLVEVGPNYPERMRKAVENKMTK